ncbi:MAG: hypothetical protein K2W82_03490 [Candidatus Obscuribacterales bacterium]|nr:hypothetical protein [Candidatus Obscuribacterales bacterium]
MSEFGKADPVETGENKTAVSENSTLSQKVVGELVDLRSAGLLEPVKAEDQNFIEEHPVASTIAGVSALAAAVYLARRGKAGVLANKADDLVKLELTGLPASKPLAQLDMLSAHADRFQRVVNIGVPVTAETVNMAKAVSAGLPVTQRTVNIVADLAADGTPIKRMAASVRLAESGAAFPLTGGKCKVYGLDGKPKILDIKDVDPKLLP